MIRVSMLLWLWSAVAAADPSETATQLRRLPLAERCALQRLLARSFIDAFDLVRSSDLPSELSFMVVLDKAAAPAGGLLLGAGESCGALSTLAHFTKRVRVKFACDTPPAGAYQWVQLDGDRLRFVRDLGDGPIDGCAGGACGPRAVMRHNAASLPTLVIELVRGKTAFETTRVALEWSTRSERF